MNEQEIAVRSLKKQFNLTDAEAQSPACTAAANLILSIFRKLPASEQSVLLDTAHAPQGLPLFQDRIVYAIAENWLRYGPDGIERQLRSKQSEIDTANKLGWKDRIPALERDKARLSRIFNILHEFEQALQENNLGAKYMLRKIEEKENRLRQPLAY